MNPLARTLPIKRASHVYLVQGGQLLMVHEKMDDGSIFYGLPGGKARSGESLGAAAVRQVRYETGLSISELNFVSLLEGEILSGTPHACFASFGRFTAQFSGELMPSDPDVVGVSWVPLEQAESLMRYGPPPECEERSPLIWLPTRDFARGQPRSYYPI
ncbi:MAG: NUDIX hydrolase [Deinococcus sp.]|nr:NUDIX hydrolase [Deinococcus sp.]